MTARLLIGIFILATLSGCATQRVLVDYRECDPVGRYHGECDPIEH